MEVRDKKVILDVKEDYEFVNLVKHITKLGYGEIRIKVKKSIPYYIEEVKKGIPLDQKKDAETYGE